MTRLWDSLTKPRLSILIVFVWTVAYTIFHDVIKWTWF